MPPPSGPSPYSGSCPPFSGSPYSGSLPLSGSSAVVCPANFFSLAQLTAKCYYDGSAFVDALGNPTGPPTTCDTDPCGFLRFIMYSWQAVTPALLPCPLTYGAGVDYGAPPDCWPAFHAQNLDYPTYPIGGPLGRGPSLVTDSATAGTVAWEDPQNAAFSDDSYATAVLPASISTHYLLATGFCFGLPANLTITNIEVTLEAHSDGSVQDVEVKLVQGGPVGTNKAVFASFPPGDTVRSYSDTPSGWGLSGLTVKDVNKPSFGVAVRMANVGGGVQTAAIDAVTINITHDPPGMIQKHSIVRLFKGEGPFFLFHEHPWIELCRLTVTSDSDGTKAYAPRYLDPNTLQWRDGEEVRLIEGQ